MATTNNPKCGKKKIPSSQPQCLSILPEIDTEDDDFEEPSPSLISSKTTSTKKPLKPLNNFATRPFKKIKKLKESVNPGKENNFMAPNFLGPPAVKENDQKNDVGFELDLLGGGLDSIDFGDSGKFSASDNEEMGRKTGEQCVFDSMDSGFLKKCGGEDFEEEFEGGTQLDVLLKLCDADEKMQADEIVNRGGDQNFCEEYGGLKKEEDGYGGLVCCPLCGKDISELNDESKQVHTNECLDREETLKDVVVPPHDAAAYQCPGQVLDGSPGHSRKVIDVTPVLEWLQNLGLAKYEEVFVQEEIDWDSLKWLTEEDLCNIGVTALGPRKKLVHAINELKEDRHEAVETQPNVTKGEADGISKLGTNKLITDYFPGSPGKKKGHSVAFKGQKEIWKSQSHTAQRTLREKKETKNVKHKDTPSWCVISGTPFRVDAFKYLRRDCCHWFLTHFHMDHYQGLTRSFNHGKIYCSPITAKLVNMKLGISWDKLQVLPLNQKISIAGIDVTCFDANHCPGAIIILFEPPNGKTVLHTGDFRFSEEMDKIFSLLTCSIHTLILDTTYCNPQYDFPKQEAVIQFVIEAIQAENFNPKTLFLIGSYTIGKERLFMEVARVLRKNVYVSTAKYRLLECLELPKEDMQWLTLNEYDSHIHVVPMWTIASFKRLKHMANQYAGRFNLIVAFSPTGWSLGKGKKKSPGKRWQQGTIIRYEVPYSEHSSYTELRDFVKLISPANIIPSVNNHGTESANKMVSQLLP